MSQADGRQMPENYTDRMNTTVAPVTELSPREYHGDSSSTGPYPGGTGEQLSGLIHDARNMVSALELYCDLLEEPGVLSAGYRHYADELRRVGAANRRLLEGLSRVDPPSETLSFPPQAVRASVANARLARLSSRWQRDFRQGSPLPADSELREGLADPEMPRGTSMPVPPNGKKVENLAAELEANRNLLAAIADPTLTLEMTIRGGACPVNMSDDDLTRVLINLVRNAAEAMPGGGHLQIALEEGPEYLMLSFTDNGPGIPRDALESIFSPGYSTHIGLKRERNAERNAWPSQHRGLGLSIVRSLVSAAGGAIWAANRTTGAGASAAERFLTRGAVFLMEFPLPEAGKGIEPSTKVGFPKGI